MIRLVVKRLVKWYVFTDLHGTRQLVIHFAVLNNVRPTLCCSFINNEDRVIDYTLQVLNDSAIILCEVILLVR